MQNLNPLNKKENVNQRKKHRENLSEQDLRNLMKKQSIYVRGPGGAFRRRQIMKF